MLIFCMWLCEEKKTFRLILLSLICNSGFDLFVSHSQFVNTIKPCCHSWKFWCYHFWQFHGLQLANRHWKVRNKTIFPLPSVQKSCGFFFFVWYVWGFLVSVLSVADNLDSPVDVVHMTVRALLLILTSISSQTIVCIAISVFSHHFKCISSL